MLRHLKNLNELTLYAALSCASSFLARINPEFFYPILLLRLSILAYCWYVIVVLESNRAFGWLLGSAILIGLLGGNWDAIELTLEFDTQKLVSNLLLVLGAILLAAVVFVSRQSNE
jgi:hypothetical protein